MNILFVVLAIALGLGIGLLILFLQRTTKTKQVPAVDASLVMDALGQSNIRAIRFVRNKIVVDFLNSDFFDPEQLKDAGALGIAIVGDTVKFYVEGTPEHNEQLYNALRELLERS